MFYWIFISLFIYYMVSLFFLKMFSSTLLATFSSIHSSAKVVDFKVAFYLSQSRCSNTNLLYHCYKKFWAKHFLPVVIYPDPTLIAFWGHKLRKLGCVWLDASLRSRSSRLSKQPKRYKTQDMQPAQTFPVKRYIQYNHYNLSKEYITLEEFSVSSPSQ